MVSGDPHHAQALREEVAAVLAPLGLRLAPEKTRTVHIDEGFDFLGHTIRRLRKRGTSKHYVYTDAHGPCSGAGRGRACGVGREHRARRNHRSLPYASWGRFIRSDQDIRRLDVPVHDSGRVGGVERSRANIAEMAGESTITLGVATPFTPAISTPNDNPISTTWARS
jgi:hypothetical protein